MESQSRDSETNTNSSNSSVGAPAEYVTVAALGTTIKSFDFIMYLFEMFPRNRFSTIINGETSVPRSTANYLIRLDEVIIQTHVRTLEAYLVL